MRTLGQACTDLGLSRRALTLWLRRLGITPTRHDLDFRLRMIEDSDVERIGAARRSIPRAGTPAPLEMASHATSGHTSAGNRRGTPPWQSIQHPAGGPSASAFHTHAEAARWLTAHGVHSDHTPKTWPGWQGVELTPHAVLTFACELERRWATNHRRNWSLRCCGAPGCVCVGVLGDTLAEVKAEEEHP